MTFLRTPEMQEYIKELPDAVPTDYQCNVNHRDCDAGTDTKERLYIKRAPDGWLFYCHHCGKKGYYRLKDVMHRAMGTAAYEAPTPPASEIVTRLERCHYDVAVTRWPPEARLWWYSYEMEDHDAYAHAVQWVPSYRRLFMKAGGTWVGRSFTDKRRYVSYRQDASPAMFINDLRATKVVIVEDVVSAYKVHKAGFNVLALLGTSISDAEIVAIKHYPSVRIWLDNDVAGMKATTELCRRIWWTTDVATFVYDQPKETPFYKIKEMLSA